MEYYKDSETLSPNSQPAELIAPPLTHLSNSLPSRREAGHGYPDTHHLLPHLFKVTLVRDNRHEVCRPLGSYDAEDVSFQCVGCRS